MKKADFILIGAVALVAAVLLFFLYGTGNEDASYVKVEADGRVIDVLPLNEDNKLEIETDNGGKNTLVLKDSAAFIEDANCPDGICANHKPISRVGESIICLPHKVVVTVIDSGEETEIDAVAQ